MSWAIAYTCKSVLGGGRKVFDTVWMWTVRFCISAKSGSYAANARRSADGRAGAAGGSIYTSGVIRACWLAGISAPTFISSRWRELRISLLLICIFTQLIEKIQTPTIFFVSPIFLHLQKISRLACSKCAHTNT